MDYSYIKIDIYDRLKKKVYISQYFLYYIEKKYIREII